MDVVYTYCNRSILFKINILLLQKNMPWVRKIFIVTKYQSIKPLERELSNLKKSFRKKCIIVKHGDIIPKKYLPTKRDNSAPKIIECYLHFIIGLGENYCYFNDDTFLLRAVKPKDIVGKAFATPFDFKMVTYHKRKKWGWPYWCSNLIACRIYKKLTKEPMQYIDIHQICPLKKSSSAKVFSLMKKDIEKSIEKNINDTSKCKKVAVRFTLLAMNYAIYEKKLAVTNMFSKMKYKYLNAGLYMEEGNMQPFDDVLAEPNMYFVCVNNCCPKRHDKKLLKFFSHYL